MRLYLRAGEMNKRVSFIMSTLLILICLLLPVDSNSHDTLSEKQVVIQKPVVIIDPGHTDKMPGALGITGKYEVIYNDNLASMLSDALTGAGFDVITTRGPAQEIKLEERAAIANSHNALAIISIHHDSAQPVYLKLIDKKGKKGYQTKKPISGYSIFVSEKNREFDRSLIFAGLLGRELIKLGRKPTLHHAEPIEGENRPLLDAKLGIYQYDDLVVLKKSEIPAVLLEVGVIVDKSDEEYVSDPAHQKEIVNAVSAALIKFKKHQFP